MLVGILHPLPPPHPQLTFLYAFFLMEYFEEGKTEPEQLNKGDPYYSSLAFNFSQFLMKTTLLLLFT